ncbi:MAG: hypothetical protein ACYS1E_20075 [Planctomycetota bacterium]
MHHVREYVQTQIILALKRAGYSEAHVLASTQDIQSRTTQVLREIAPDAIWEADDSVWDALISA